MNPLKKKKAAAIIDRTQKTQPAPKTAVGDHGRAAPGSLEHLASSPPVRPTKGSPLGASPVSRGKLRNPSARAAEPHAPTKILVVLEVTTLCTFLSSLTSVPLKARSSTSAGREHRTHRLPGHSAIRTWTVVTVAQAVNVLCIAQMNVSKMATMLSSGLPMY